MGNIVLLGVLILSSLSVIGTAQDLPVYDEVVNYENCSNCYFLVLNVNSKAYKGKVAIENDEFREFFAKTTGQGRDDYADYVRKLFLEKKELKLKDALLDSSKLFLNVPAISQREFRVIMSEDEGVDNIAGKGCIRFVRYFFLGESLSNMEIPFSGSCRTFISTQRRPLLLSRQLSFAAKNTIILQLFNWDIPVRVDDLSGLLAID